MFYLVNTGSVSAQFTLSFFDENGIALPVPLLLPQSGTNVTTSALTQTLAAGAMLVVNTQAQDALALVIGSAQLTTTGNISGFEIFRWTTFGQEASVPLETRTPNSFVLVFDDTNGLTTGVALANLRVPRRTSRRRFRDDTGTQMESRHRSAWRAWPHIVHATGPLPEQPRANEEWLSSRCRRAANQCHRPACQVRRYADDDTRTHKSK